MQASLAFNQEILRDNYPFSELVDQEVNTLIFPNLAAGNIAYNLMKEIGGADAIGPILLGMKKPVHVLQLGSSVRSIYNMALIAVIDAQIKCKASVQDDVKNRTGGNATVKKAKKPDRLHRMLYFYGLKGVIKQ
jgi:allosteric NADP-dependent malic enzyme (EC 1.1.1.40)